MYKRNLMNIFFKTKNGGIMNRLKKADWMLRYMKMHQKNEEMPLNIEERADDAAKAFDKELYTNSVPWSQLEERLRNLSK